MSTPEALYDLYVEPLDLGMSRAHKGGGGTKARYFLIRHLLKNPCTLNSFNGDYNTEDIYIFYQAQLILLGLGQVC